LEFDDPALKNLLVDLDEQGRQKAAKEPVLGFRHFLDVRASQKQEETLNKQARELPKNAVHVEDEIDILNQLIEQERARQGISSPMEG
jgi:DNA primase